MKTVGGNSGPGHVDPRALGELLVGVRNLLRHHQRIGIRAYPDKKRFASLLIRRKSGIPPRPAAPAASGSALPVPRLDEVHAEISQCRSCSGNHPGPFLPARNFSCPARLVVVGDWCRASPPADTFWCDKEEDEMLWRMMKAMGLKRDRVYVTNVLKCPPRGDTADPGPARQCLPHLHREIAAAGAPIVLAMGEYVVSALLGGGQPLVRMRGRLHARNFLNRRVLVIPTFHPHFLLRYAEMKQPAWQDLLLAKRYLAENK